MKKAVLLHCLLQYSGYYFLNYYATGFFISGLIFLLGLLGFLELLEQRQRLMLALRLASSASITPLHRAQSVGQQLALEVRVRRDAPLLEAPLTQSRYAWWSVRAEEHFKLDGKVCSGSKKVSSSNQVPIFDESGRGLLALSEASLFLNAHYKITSTEKLKPNESAPFHWFRPKAAILLEESHISPEEPLFILGRVSQLQASNEGDAIETQPTHQPLEALRPS